MVAARVLYHGVPEPQSFPLRALAEKVRHVPLAGDIDDMNHRLAEGRLLSLREFCGATTPVARRHCGLADTLRILRLPIAGIIRDHSDLMSGLH